MNTDLTKYKEKLIAEKKAVEEQLQSLGVKSSQGPLGWEASQKDINDDEPSDRTETADNITEYDSDVAIVNTLDAQLMEVNDALARIENGTYGTCKVCGKEIESDRLAANPSASTCKADMGA